MQYMVTFPLTSHLYEERIERFLETGALPPDGVTLLGRWFTLGQDLGFALIETDTPGLVFQYLAEWADLMDFEVHPVIGDEEAAAALQAVGQGTATN